MSCSSFKISRLIGGNEIFQGGTADLAERRALLDADECPDCGGCVEDVRHCKACEGTGRPPKCVQCGQAIDPLVMVVAVETYCPKCAATEIDKLWKDNEFLLAEVERLRVLLKETCQAGIALAEGVGHA